MLLIFALVITLKVFFPKWLYLFDRKQVSTTYGRNTYEVITTANINRILNILTLIIFNSLFSHISL